MSSIPAARLLGGFLYVVGCLLALIASWNVHFGEGVIVGQLVVGFIGLGFAFFYATTLKENPQIQLVATGGLALLACVMLVPAMWRAFTGAALNGAQIATAVLGGLLIFVNWRMLPR